METGGRYPAPTIANASPKEPNFCQAVDKKTSKLLTRQLAIKQDVAKNIKP